MSHAIGAVRFNKDGLIMFYEYNGTVDIVQPTLYKTKQEVDDNWRNDDWNTCNCGSQEDVEIVTTYGYGSYFEGKACRECMAIVSPITLDEFMAIQRDGLPEWSPWSNEDI